MAQATPSQPPAPIPDYTGTYTLTITADGACTQLPDELKRRTYTANIEQTGSALRVSLSGADFILSGRDGASFDGDVSPTGELTFRAQPTGFYNPGWAVRERLADGRALCIAGTILDKSSVDGISGRAHPVSDGAWIYRCDDANVYCSINRFDLVRR